MKNRELVGTISHGGQSVEVSRVEGMTGYSFDAVGESSLPLAAELAVSHTQKGKSYIDKILTQGR